MRNAANDMPHINVVADLATSSSAPAYQPTRRTVDDTPWQAVRKDCPFTIFTANGFSLVDRTGRPTLTPIVHTQPPWKLCVRPEDNRENPVYKPWADFLEPIPHVSTFFEELEARDRDTLLPKSGDGGVTTQAQQDAEK